MTIISTKLKSHQRAEATADVFEPAGPVPLAPEQHLHKHVFLKSSQMFCLMVPTSKGVPSFKYRDIISDSTCPAYCTVLNIKYHQI